MARFWLVRLGSVLLVGLLLFALDRFAVGRLNDFQIRLVVLGGIYVTLAVSLNLINGITGQFSLGHIAFYAIGAYTAAASAQYLAPRLGLTNPVLVVLLGTLLGTVLAAVAGVLVGLPSLRLRGDYLAIVTLGVGEIVRVVVQNQAVLGKSYGTVVPPKIAYVWLAVGLATLTVAICRNLQVSARGLDFLAVREDEIAASAMGVNVTRTKVQAFVIGSAFAGAAGAIAAHNEGFISPSLYTMDYSILIVTMVVLGGAGSITGSILAALALFGVPEALRSFPGASTATVLAILVAIVLATAALRWTARKFAGRRLPAALAGVGVLLAASAFAFVLTAILGNVPALRVLVEGNKLRQVIPALTLVVMMLLRPQGIFGHAEIGWGTLFGRFGDPSPPTGPGGHAVRPTEDAPGPGPSAEPAREGGLS